MMNREYPEYFEIISYFAGFFRVTKQKPDNVDSNKKSGSLLHSDDKTRKKKNNSPIDIPS